MTVLAFRIGRKNRYSNYKNQPLDEED